MCTVARISYLSRYALLLCYALAVSTAFKVSGLVGNSTGRYACSGDTVTFECCVKGGTYTVWQGSGFDCESTRDQLVLLHTRSMGNNTDDTATCSNRAIVAQSVSVEGDYYTSQLSITIAYSIPLGSILNITCKRDNGTVEVTVQNYTITVGNSEYSSMICGSSDVDMSFATEEMSVNKGSTTVTVILGFGITVGAVVVLISAVIIGFVVIRKKKVVPRIMTCYSVRRSTTPGNELQHMETQSEPYSHLCFDQSLSIANVAYNRSLSEQDQNQYSVMAMTGNSNNPLKCFRQESLNLDSLLVKVRRKMDTKQWYIFGREIGVPTEFLEKLKDYPDSECLIEVADHWLRNHPDKPTWSEIEHIVTKLAQTTSTNTEGPYDLPVQLDVHRETSPPPPPRPPRQQQEKFVTPPPPIPPKP